MCHSCVAMFVLRVRVAKTVKAIRHIRLVPIYLKIFQNESLACFNTWRMQYAWLFIHTYFLCCLSFGFFSIGLLVQHNLCVFICMCMWLFFFSLDFFHSFANSCYVVFISLDFLLSSFWIVKQKYIFKQFLASWNLSFF